MPLTVLAPCSLSRWAGSRADEIPPLPGLESLLEGAALEISDVPLERTLATLVGLALDDASTVPVAPLRLAADGRADAARDGWWMAADPVTTSLWTDNVAIEARPTDIERGDADAFVAALDRTFADDGLSFVAGAPQHWYVRCRPTPMLETTPLWQTLGRPMRDALPRGADGPSWRARLNEAQMLLHGSPVNARREAAGRTRVDSIWWWGGGEWPRFRPPAVAHVVGGPPWLALACRENRVAHEPLPAAGDTPAWLAHADGRATLAVADDDWERPVSEAERLAEWDRRVFAPLAAALASRRLDAAELEFGWRSGSLRVRCAAARPSPFARVRRFLGARHALGGRAEKPPRALRDVLAALER